MSLPSESLQSGMSGICNAVLNQSTKPKYRDNRRQIRFRVKEEHRKCNWEPWQIRESGVEQEVALQFPAESAWRRHGCILQVASLPLWQE